MAEADEAVVDDGDAAENPVVGLPEPEGRAIAEQLGFDSISVGTMSAGEGVSVLSVILIGGGIEAVEILGKCLNVAIPSRLSRWIRRTLGGAG